MATDTPARLAASHPRGCTIVVRRRHADSYQYLLLHRTIGGPGSTGLWAWCAPSGVRRETEPVFAAVSRILSESCGITGANILPVDLGRQQSLWLATVDADTVVTPDGVDFDEYDWVDQAEAEQRCLPAVNAECFGFTARIPNVDIDFRATTTDDADTFAQWSNNEHIAPWFGKELSADDAAHATNQDTFAALGGAQYIITIDGRDSGVAQFSQVIESAPLFGALGRPDGLTCHLLNADVALRGNGLGPHLLWTFLHRTALRQHPRTNWIFAPVRPNDAAGLRHLQKSGFDRGAITDIVVQRDETVCSVYLPHWITASKEST